ncbi:histone methyltransferase set2 [Thecaphora frezii]
MASEVDEVKADPEGVVDPLASMKLENGSAGGLIDPAALPEADNTDLDDNKVADPEALGGKKGAAEAKPAPPSFSPSPSPPPASHASPGARSAADALKSEATEIPGPTSPKLKSDHSDDGDYALDGAAIERGSSRASSAISADRKVKKSASVAPPQLISHLPRAEKEALSTFTELTANEYHDKKLGRAPGGWDAMVCVCNFTPGVDDEVLACSADSGCINRATQIECIASECQCGKYCQNQRFQRRQYADVEIVLTENKGFGLRAATDVKRESFVYEYVGEVMNETLFRQRMQQYRVDGIRHFYFMMLQKGEYLDATLKGGRGRFINHSCNPNCYVAKWQVGKHMRMGIFALRDIAKGEELTFNYNVDRYGNDAQTCYCGEPNCVGTLGGKTQTDIGGIPNLFIQALGISEQVKQMEAKGTKKRSSKELDHDFVPILRPVEMDEAFKVMTGIRQANANQQILQKLLTRVEMTEDPSVQKLLVKLHGFTAMYGVLVDWKDDRNIIMLALSSLSRWPLIAKNKVVDSGIEAQVIFLRDFYRKRSVKKEEDGGANSAEAKEDLSVSHRAEQLLDAWNKLDMGYRIARREADDAAATADVAQREAGFAAYVDRRRYHELEEPPVTLEEAQAPNAVSEELGLAMPEWTRSERDMPLRQHPAIGRKPMRINGLPGQSGGGYFSPARNMINGGFGPRAVGGSPMTPDPVLPASPAYFHKHPAPFKTPAPPTPSQSIEDIIRQANEEVEQQRKEAEARAKAARDAEWLAASSSSSSLLSSSSPRKHARPHSDSVSSLHHLHHADKRRKSSTSDAPHTSRVSLASIGVDFDEDGTARAASLNHEATDAAASQGRASSGSAEKKLRKMIGDIVVKQMSKHRDEFERETFKKYAKELTSIIAGKEMKNPKHWPPPSGALPDEFAPEKRTKIKAFCADYIAKLVAKKGKRIAAAAAGAGTASHTSEKARGERAPSPTPPTTE